MEAQAAEAEARWGEEVARLQVKTLLLVVAVVPLVLLLSSPL